MNINLLPNRVVNYNEIWYEISVKVTSIFKLDEIWYGESRNDIVISRFK